MFSFTLLLANLKNYGQAVLITLVALTILATGIYICLLRHELDKAKAQKAVLQLTVNGYEAAAKALQAKLDAAAKQLLEVDEENKELMDDLHKTLPKDPAEANAWAIAAAGKIRKEAGR